MDTNKITTVKIKTDTKSLLDKMKIIERESYDDVIKRLIQDSSKKQTEQTEPSLSSKKILPEVTQDFKGERAKLFQGFLGARSNKKEIVEKEDRKESKEKAKISSEFRYD